MNILMSLFMLGIVGAELVVNRNASAVMFTLWTFLLAGAAANLGACLAVRK